MERDARPAWCVGAECPNFWKDRHGEGLDSRDVTLRCALAEFGGNEGMVEGLLPGGIIAMCMEVQRESGEVEFDDDLS